MGRSILFSSISYLLLLGPFLLPSSTIAQPLLSVQHGFLDGWGPDGEHPRAALLKPNSKGIIYGVTELGGGIPIWNCSSGCGTVFELIPDNGKYDYKILYSFCPAVGCVDGSLPEGGLVADLSGNLYGVTAQGGAYNHGTVFKLTHHGVGWNKWTLKTIKSLCVDDPFCSDGSTPISQLTYDGITKGDPYDGASPLYLAIGSGGLYGKGVVLKIVPGSKWRVIHDFCAEENCSDGATPYSVVAKDGWLYGTTGAGGFDQAGVLFKLSAATGKIYTTLHSFCARANCADGSNADAPLAINPKGTLFGTAMGGGAHNNGIIFRYNSNGFTILHTFCDVYQTCAEGSQPNSIVMDAGGTLYGTTQVGGPCGSVSGDIFRLKPPYSASDYSVQYTFCAGSDAYNPQSSVLLDGSGNIFGTTYSGNTYYNGFFYDFGTVFELPLK